MLVEDVVCRDLLKGPARFPRVGEELPLESSCRLKGVGSVPALLVSVEDVDVVEAEVPGGDTVVADRVAEELAGTFCVVSIGGSAVGVGDLDVDGSAALIVGAFEPADCARRRRIRRDDSLADLVKSGISGNLGDSLEVRRTRSGVIAGFDVVLEGLLNGTGGLRRSRAVGGTGSGADGALK